MSSNLPFQLNDGGRAQAGFKGRAGDCVCRSISIAAGLPYATVYKALAKGNSTSLRVTASGDDLKRRPRSARNGIEVSRKWFKDYMHSLGFVWTPCCIPGSSHRVHLIAGGGLPTGRLVVALSKHYTAVIDGVIHDTYNPLRTTMKHQNNITTFHYRMVYGYWQFKPQQEAV
jgi:hypothetical protein